MTKFKLDDKWRQVSGDMDPGAHGCVLARTTDNGLTIDLLEVQPVREYVGDGEASEVGFPFWSREATYWVEDLKTDPRFEPDRENLIELACAAMLCGVDVEESTAGWARDVFPAKAYYWCNRRPVSGAFFSSEDAEFRRLLKESR
jgi:hypothetical protein